MENNITNNNKLDVLYKDIDNCKSDIANITNEINNLFSVIEKRNQNWSQSKVKLDELHLINNEGICTLNIGGTFFQTSLYTLRKLKGTLFYNQILSNEIVAGKVTFYDRDPDLFHILLNYLRRNTFPDISSLSEEEKEQLIVEAEFYLITPLVNRMKYSSDIPPLGIQSVLIEGSNYHLIKGDNKNTILNRNDNTKGIIMKDIKGLTIKYNQVVEYDTFYICGLNLESIPYHLREKWNLFNEENDSEAINNTKEIIVLSSIDNEKWNKLEYLPSFYNENLITVRFNKVKGQYIKFCIENAFFHISHFKLNIMNK